jgi:DNA-3-methyladenine glycosylase
MTLLRGLEVVMSLQPLPREFYLRDTVTVALDLLGKRLVRATRWGRLEGRIVEVEAYLAEGDPACHAARGPTRKSAVMFGPAGLLYVYAIHSRHCLNVVTEPRGVGAAVLIRALEPIAGIPVMQRQRGREKPLELTRGPGRLCEALAVDRRLNGWNLTRGQRIWIRSEPAGETLPAPRILTSPRIGISTNQEALLRFFVADNPFVSGKRHGLPVTSTATQTSCCPKSSSS